MTADSLSLRNLSAALREVKNAKLAAEDETLSDLTCDLIVRATELLERAQKNAAAELIQRIKDDLEVQPRAQPVSLQVPEGVPKVQITKESEPQSAE